VLPLTHSNFTETPFENTLSSAPGFPTAIGGQSNISIVSLNDVNAQSDSEKDLLDTFLDKGFDKTKDRFDMYLAGEATHIKKERNLFI
jgi:hypothetical protein